MTAIIADFKQKDLSTALLRLLNIGDVIRQLADVEERVGVVKVLLAVGQFGKSLAREMHPSQTQRRSYLQSGRSLFV